MTSLPTLPPGTGVMLCGHGSRNQLAVGEFAVLASRLSEKLPGVPVEYGYLEFADPVIHHGLDRLRAQGLNRILAVPGMLFAAGHAKNDIPSVLNTYAAQHPGFEITYGRELGVDLKMLRAAGDRIAEGIAASPRKIPHAETLLLVVETFVDRIQEMLVGQNLMNCAMCKYREQVLGFEAEVGLAQESHHHHVEGIGGGLEDCPCAGDCDSSCRDEAFCVAHNLPWTPVHAHDHHQIGRAHV